MVKSKVPSIYYSETASRVLLSLLEGEKRFSQLIDEGKKASVARILKDLLEQRYILRRVVDNPPPPKTFYSLTEKGKKLLREQKDQLLSRHKIALNRLKLLDKF